MDRACHASRDPASIWPNKPLFLLHEGKVWKDKQSECQFGAFGLVGSVRLYFWRLKARKWMASADHDLVQYASDTSYGMTGLSWTELSMHLSNRLHWLGIDLSQAGLVEQFSFIGSLKVKYHLLWCLQWKKSVDYLLIAKPVAINHSRIRRGCCDILWMICRLLVVLPEDHDLCCFTVTGRSVSEICETGEQGVLTVGSELLVNSFKGLNTDLSCSWIFDHC